MRPVLESATLQRLAADVFAADKPIAAICHGVLLAARSCRPDGRSALYGRITTALTWRLERSASILAHIGRPWDRPYYRTDLETKGQPAGHMSVQQEVTRALARPEDFRDVEPLQPDHRRKTSGPARDTDVDSRPAFVVRDGRYVSARWPGDAHTFAKIFAAVLDEAVLDEAVLDDAETASGAEGARFTSCAAAALRPLRDGETDRTALTTP